MVRNYSLIIEFILTGIKVHPDLKIFLCFMFPVIYLVTIVGNLSLMTDLCRTPSSHIHVHLSGQTGSHGYLLLLVSQDVRELLVCGQNDFSLCMHGAVLFSLCFWNCRLLSSGSNEIWPLCGHMQPTEAPHHEVEEALHSDEYRHLHS